jgi:hypothetical protein
MKLVKTSAIAVAISALLAGPVLAQGASSDTQIRGGAQGKTQMQGGASGSVDEDTFVASNGVSCSAANAEAVEGLRAVLRLCRSNAPAASAEISEACPRFEPVEMRCERRLKDRHLAECE